MRQAAGGVERGQVHLIDLVECVQRPLSGRSSPNFLGDNQIPGSVPATTLTDGTLYRYRAWTRSYYDNQSDYIPGPSNASTTGWCYFKIDSTAPKAPTVTFTQTYTECLPNACVAAGGPKVSGSASVAAASGDTVHCLRVQGLVADVGRRSAPGNPIPQCSRRFPAPTTWRCGLRTTASAAGVRRNSQGLPGRRRR